MIALDLPKLAKWGAVLAIIVGVWAHGYAKGNDAGEVAVAELRAEHAETLAGISDATAKAYEAARLREHAVAEELARIDSDHQEAMRHASESARNSVLADVRAGRLVVRHAPIGCGLPAAAAPAAAAGIDHGAADQRGGDALALAVAEQVGIAARADERLAACQAVIEAYRAASATGADQPRGGVAERK